MKHKGPDVARRPQSAQVWVRVLCEGHRPGGHVLKCSEWRLKVHDESTLSSAWCPDVRLCGLLGRGARRRAAAHKHHSVFVVLRMVRENDIAITPIM